VAAEGGTGREGSKVGVQVREFGAQGTSPGFAFGSFGPLFQISLVPLYLLSFCSFTSGSRFFVAETIVGES